MDPQQRLLLELGYAALHGACARRVTLMSGDEGVFLGIERPDWALVQPPAARRSVYAVVGDSVSVAAGRLSFVLGLQGACASVDTACSSSLVATSLAASAVRSAVVMSANLQLAPHGTLGTAAAGMLSIDGRCKTLDARANGYARSEAGCAAFLHPCDAGSTILVGSAVRSDGRSASLTAPNGSA